MNSQLLERQKVSMKWLCQDCLAVTESESEPVCRNCGGETCNCFSCMHTLDRLENGIRNYKELGLKTPIKGWTVNGCC